MRTHGTTYVFRDEVDPEPTHDPEGRDVVIADGEAMTYRRYRGPRRTLR
ncbi:hypothetical protein ACFQE1_06725 [Halobium palmae]|uniref:Uncharacterized protein n=1 Tax=Halobium palmae TaxID=1776492 RepID=A0ABD5RZ83_9EURY